MRVYIAGKVRGLEREEAVRAFAKAASMIEAMGDEPVNPLEIVDSLPEDVRKNERELMLALLEELSGCDAIWMIKGWRSSPGATCEHAFARSTGITVTGHCEDLLGDVLSSLYSPTGPTEALSLKTSAEVAFEIEDMRPAPPSDVAEWLEKNGFQTRVVDGTVFWILYEMQ